MATEAVLKTCADSLSRVQSFDASTLSREADLGKQMSFADAVQPAAAVISVYKRIPLSALPDFSDSQLSAIQSQANADFSVFNQILEFNATAGDAAGTRTNILTQLQFESQVSLTASCLTVMDGGRNPTSVNGCGSATMSGNLTIAADGYPLEICNRPPVRLGALALLSRLEHSATQPDRFAAALSFVLTRFGERHLLRIIGQLPDVAVVPQTPQDVKILDHAMSAWDRPINCFLLQDTAS